MPARLLCLVLTCCLFAPLTHAIGICGPEGVWVQFLGSGGPELGDKRAGSAYLVWIDGAARLMVGAGPGASVRFDEGGADFSTLEALVFLNLTPDAAGDFASLVRGSYRQRERPLPLLGPAGNEYVPSTTEFVERLIGRDGAFPMLADYLTFRGNGGYKITPRDIPATGQRTWAGYSNAYFKLIAAPVHHGHVPALAWKVIVGEQSIVFAGSASNQKGTLARLAEGADILIVYHAIPEGARGEILDEYMTPTQIGRLADLANVRFLMLSNRTSRTRGRESISRAHIETQFDGDVTFANDMDCWGL